MKCYSPARFPFIIIFSFFFVSNLFSQSFEIDWQQCFGGSSNDEAWDIVNTANGYLIVGSTYSDDGDISINHGQVDGWLVKTDLYGKMIEERSYGGSLGDSFSAIFKSSDNKYFIIGGSNSLDGDISNNPYPNSFNFWILKIDESGEIIWDKMVGGNGNDVSYSGIATSDGGVIAYGYTNSEDGDVSTHYGSYDIWLIKLNSSGEVEWEFTLGNDLFEFGYTVIETSDGDLLIGGSSMPSDGGNIDCEMHGEVYTDGVLVKLDSLLNIEWQQCYGGSKRDGIVGLLEVEDGFVLNAYSESSNGDVSGWHGEVDIWIVKVDLSGNILWQNCFGGSKFESARNIFITQDGVISVIGDTQSQDGDISWNHSVSVTDSDIWIIQLSSAGSLLGEQCIGGAGDNFIEFGSVKVDDNSFVIAGNSDHGPSYDITCTTKGEIDFWLFKAFDTLSRIDDFLVKDWDVQVYPIPGKDFVFIEFDLSLFSLKNEKPHLQIVDILGKIVHTSDLVELKTKLNLSNFQPGVYFYKIVNANQSITGRFIISQ